ncbi:protein Shroom2 isoform X2 [Oncorhynchus mykiss]|uniref:Protein Shroom2-like n=1 Tax=Oncorhynchus mykiss TaxID=8022 RepID=A0A8K9XBE2_ONCMY|nr:protein Shroom2 isoform X2 [Oncorhynchus mykiss]
MDTMDSRSEPRYSDGDHNHWLMERPEDMDQRSREGWRLVDVLLSGGAPWGFTLKGGREHREPLLITKVEEGSKAAAVSLQVGDEMLNINQVPLSGYRQEAICLVKGSYKTLNLVVKRRNEAVSRPHSWHATKFNESQSETAKTQSPPPPVWQTRYDASFPSTNLSSSGWDQNQTNLRRVSDQFSSLGSMDSLDVSHHPYPPGHQSPGRFSPVKSNTSTEHLGGGKRDSAYSSFSTNSGTPDYTLSKTPDYTLSKTPDYTLSKTPDHTLPKTPDHTLPKTPDHTLPKTPDHTLPKTPDHTLPKTPDYTLLKSNAASTENMLYEVSQWESGGQPSNGRHSLSSEGVRQDERPGYLQLAGGHGAIMGRDSPRTTEQSGSGSSHSSSSARASCGPVWHVPDKKKTSYPSPPPSPPVRSDSFAATKSHENVLVIACPEGPGAHTQPKAHGKGMDNSDNSQCTNDSRRSHHNLPSKNNMVPPYISPKNCHPNQVNCNKLCSLSSSDVRLGQLPPTYLLGHQRQYSNESSLYSHPRTWSVPKQQNVSICYSSMQELPTNYNAQNTQLYSQTPDSTGDSRYYCVTARQPGQPVTQALLVKTDERRGGGGREEGVEGGGERRSAVSIVQGGGDKKSLTPLGSEVTNAKYQPPPPLNNDSKGYSRQDDGSRHKQPATVCPSAVLESSTGQPSLKRNNSQTAEPHCMSYPPRRQSLQPLQQDTIHRQEMLPDSQICPQTTSGLSNSGLVPRDCSSVETVDLSSNQCTRTDRFATTLRNEIQMRRAQLQKSKSAASLSGPCEVEENHEVPEVWRPKDTTSSSDGSFTSTYKDHLKEAQARVLKVTSFRRRDLEPVLLEHPVAEAGSLPDYSSSGLGRSDNSNPLSSLSEGLPARSGSAQSQVTRIGSRKRFTTEKKVRCFSEPDKINEVGVEEELTPPEAADSLLNQRSTPRPAFTRPLPKTALPGPVEDCGEGKEIARGDCDMSSSRKEQRECQGQDNRQQALLELQRLGTFAEYETTWNTQKKAAETRGSGCSHSADNILDPGKDDRTKPAPVHERSRSSPSADFYDKSHVPGRKSAEYSQLESQPAQQDNNTTARLSDRCRVGEFRGRVKREKALEPLELKDFPEPPPPVTNEESPDIRSTSAPCPAYHSPTSISYQPLETDFPPPDESYTEHKTSIPQLHIQLQSGTRRKGPLPPPRQDHSRHPQNTHSQESLSRSQGGASASRAPVSSHFASGPTHSPRGDSEQSRGLVAREQETVHQVVPSNPGPALPALPSIWCHRSPSPQFAPPQLTDKPPVSLQQHHDNPVSVSVCLHYDQNNRMENVIEPTSVRKVPIKIIHSESEKEKESRQYLLRHSHSTVEEAQGPSLVPLNSLGTSGAPEQSYSLFCAYSRQRDQGPEREKTLAPPSYPAPELPTPPPPYQTPEMDLEQHRDTHMCPLRVHNSQMAVLATSPPSRQTTSDPEPPSGNCVSPPVPLPHSEEDVKTEQLARDIMNKDRSLADILDKSWRRTTMDLMEGLFPQGEVLLEGKERRKVSLKHSSPRPSEDRSEEDSVAGAVSLVTSSTYYSTSAPKAELLIKLKDMQEREGLEEELEEESADELDHDLANKKQELVDSLSRKLQVLREARESLQEDVRDNNALGEEVEATVQQVCMPNQLDKFRMFIGDLDKVVSLLLSLSGRLARVENALNSLEDGTSPEERRTLTDKRKLLIQQHEDAKELKENLDRRERAVYNILASYLPEESLTDYQHFVKMKSALIIEQRKLEDKIKLGEEQLKCLMDSLPLEQRMSL